MNCLTSLCRYTAARRPDVLCSMRGLLFRHIAPAPHPRHYFTAPPCFQHFNSFIRRPPALQRVLPPCRHYCSSPHRPATNFTRRKFALATVPLIGIGVGVAVIADSGNLETVPYTNRTHFVFRSPMEEREYAESTFASLKETYPSINHPDSVRVNNITSKLVRAVHRNLIIKSHVHDAGSRPETRHLNGINWEVIIIKVKTDNVWSCPGKILISTAMLDRQETDDDIAFLIAHEIGHTVARHWAEKIVYWWLPSPLRVPFFRRTETEADHIGMMLLAAAGFDPRIAAKLEKLGDDNRRFLSPYPSNKKRSKLLSQPKIMEEALKLYREVSPGQDTEGSL